MFNFDVFKGSKLESAPLVSPVLNLGCGMDVVNGFYVEGDKGQMVLIGGAQPLNGIAARPNKFKSSVFIFTMMRILARYKSSSLSIYDSENFVEYGRIGTMMKQMPELVNQADELLNSESDISKRLVLNKKNQMLLDEWWEKCKDLFDVKRSKANINRLTLTMPVKDRNGKNIKALVPTVLGIDALTSGKTSEVYRISDDNNVDSSEQNSLAMRDGLVKSRLIDHMSAVAQPAGAFIFMTAQIDNKVEVSKGPMSVPPPKALDAMRQGDNFKSVGTQFHKLTNQIVEIRKSENCWDAANKPLYPKDKMDNEIRDSDLKRLHLIYLRSKTGGDAGVFTTLVVSKEEGILPCLSLFDYLRFQANNYGLDVGGNNAFFTPVIWPEADKITRTSARLQLKNNAKMERCLEILVELHQIKKFKSVQYGDLVCEPRELYEDLKSAGYDWDTLLNTRGYWTFEEEECTIPYLSTLDLLRMRKGLYKPYWM